VLAQRREGEGELLEGVVVVVELNMGSRSRIYLDVREGRRSRVFWAPCVRHGSASCA
jgi:hypothetical protein